MTMTFGSLFSGIGGFDLGFERAGMQCVWRSEIDPACNALMAKRQPDVPNLGDVRNVGRNNAEPVDLICGGFPCQDLSVAGKRAGLAGERSGLWFEYHRVLDELRPQWVVIENVPGLLSSNGGRDFAIVLRGLVELRYGVTWRILDAQYFGVAQHRRRVFIVGSLGSGRSAEVLFEREGGSGDTPPRREAGQGVATYSVRSAQTSSNGIGINEHTAYTLDEGNGQAVAYGGNRTSGPIDVATACNAHGGTGRSDFESETFVLGFDRSRSTISGDVAATLRVKGDGAPLVAFTERTRKDGRNLESQEDLAYALTNPGGGGRANIAGSFGVRRLTPTECERLQGFPDGWTEPGQSDSARYRQLGNAVAVPCAYWIGTRIVEQENAGGN